MSATVHHRNLPAAGQSAAPPSTSRLESIELLRGIVIILMALDHTRDFLGIPGVNPTDPAQTTVTLFFTRWVTHFCAPVFFLLTGAGAYLQSRRMPVPQLSRYLAVRGLWLVFLELTLLRCFGFQFNFDYHVTLINVLWALGWSMVVLSALVYLPLRVIAVLSLVVIAGHNLLDPVQSSNPLWSVLHRPGFLLNVPGHSVFVAYPLIPWFAVMAAGFALGRIYDWTQQQRRALLLRAGLGSIALFLILRAINVYGDPVQWKTQRSAIFTLLSFLNTNKYPPSLLFLLMTLGPALLLLWAVDRGTPHFLRPALTFGKVPLFFFLLHIPLLHLMATVVCYARYSQIHWMFESPTIAQFPFTTPPGWGLPLPLVYVAWICVVAAMYPLCRWFAAVKARRRAPWLSYL